MSVTHRDLLFPLVETRTLDEHDAVGKRMKGEDACCTDSFETNIGNRKAWQLFEMVSLPF